MQRQKVIIGWREWVGLPDLGVTSIKAKIDTGARTSALHAHNLVEENREDGLWASFVVQPMQRRRFPAIACRARIVERRRILSSNGQSERRPIIRTRLHIGPALYEIELTLTNRDQMGFRMLIGRQALRRRFVIDPGQSYLRSLPGQAA
ncbi:MAG: RimK/LysX family protein [Sneathiellaceae bacterium]